MVRRRVSVVALAATLSVGPMVVSAAAQEGLDPIVWGDGAVEVFRLVDALEGSGPAPVFEPVAPGGGFDLALDPLTIIDAGVAVLDGPGGQLACPFFGGNALTDGAQARWDIAEFCADSTAFYDVSVQTVIAVAL